VLAGTLVAPPVGCCSSLRYGLAFQIPLSCFAATAAACTGSTFSSTLLLALELLLLAILAVFPRNWILETTIAFSW
jgi:hypothetical protein